MTCTYVISGGVAGSILDIRTYNNLIPGVEGSGSLAGVRSKFGHLFGGPTTPPLEITSQPSSPRANRRLRVNFVSGWGFGHKLSVKRRTRRGEGAACQVPGQQGENGCCSLPCQELLSRHPRMRLFFWSLVSTLNHCQRLKLKPRARSSVILVVAQYHA